MPRHLSDTQLVQEIQQIIATNMFASDIVRKVRDLLDEADLAAEMGPDTRPIATDDKGWPMLNEDGSAWERHDDPEVDQ